MAEVDLDALRRHPLNGEAEDIQNLVVWMEQQDAILAALERAKRVEAEWVAFMGRYEVETTPRWQTRSEFATLAALADQPGEEGGRG